MRVSGSHVGPLAAMPGGIRAGNLVETGMVGGAVLASGTAGRRRRSNGSWVRPVRPCAAGSRRRTARGGLQGPRAGGQRASCATTDLAVRPYLLALLGPLLMVIVSALQFWFGTACSAP